MLISNQLPVLQLHLSKPDLQKLLQNLQPGQLLKATVVGQASENIVKLKMGTQELVAHTRLRLEIGQKLTMEVRKGGEIPELKLLREHSSAEVKAKILRQVLPKQIPQAKFFNTLQLLERATPELIQKLLPELLRKSTQHPEQKGSIPLPQKTDTTPLQKPLTDLLQNQPPKVVQKPAESQQQPAQPTTPTSASASASTKALPSDLQKTIQTILAKVLPQGTNISAPQIRQLLLSSGLFLEANLASGNPAQASGDLKANLLNLLLLLRHHLQPDQIQQQIKLPQSQQSKATAAASGNRTLFQLLGELVRQTEGSLARVQTHQLSSLPREEASGQIWQFELPIQQPDRVDSFLIRLEQEQQGKKKKAGEAWKITLNFDFSPLGPIEAKLSLKGEEISALFLVEQATSAALLEQSLPKLNDAFTRVGLKVGHLHSQQGKSEPPSTTLPTSTFLLDEKA